MLMFRRHQVDQSIRPCLIDPKLSPKIPLVAETFIPAIRSIMIVRFRNSSKHDLVSSDLDSPCQTQVNPTTTIKAWCPPITTVKINWPGLHSVLPRVSLRLQVQAIVQFCSKCWQRAQDSDNKIEKCLECEIHWLDLFSASVQARILFDMGPLLAFFYGMPFCQISKTWMV